MAERARARTNPHNSGFGPSSDNKATSALPDPHRGAQHGPRAALTPPSSPGPRPPQPGPDPRSCSRRASSAANHQSRGVEEGLGGGGREDPSVPQARPQNAARGQSRRLRSPGARRDTPGPARGPPAAGRCRPRAGKGPPAPAASRRPQSAARRRRRRLPPPGRAAVKIRVPGPEAGPAAAGGRPLPCPASTSPPGLLHPIRAAPTPV